MFAPLDDAKELGFTEQVVAFAGTEQEAVTVDEKPNSGITKMSLMY
jgi:hypothetical protein